MIVGSRRKSFPAGPSLYQQTPLPVTTRKAHDETDDTRLFRRSRLRLPLPTCTSIVYRSSDVPFSPSAKRFASLPLPHPLKLLTHLFTGSPGTDRRFPTTRPLLGESLVRGALALAFIVRFPLSVPQASGKDRKDLSLSYRSHQPLPKARRHTRPKA